MDLKECYAIAEGDYEDVMRRFLKEERVDKFLQMFLKDQSYEHLCQAMEEKDYERAFVSVHTMKGIAMNLSLTALANVCITMTENLRGRTYNEQTEDCFSQLKVKYECADEAIRNHLGLE